MTPAPRTATSTPSGSRWDVAAPLAVGAAAAAVAVRLAVAGPHVPGVECPSRWLTGLDCPGCGSTRSVAALLDGDMARALDHHLLVPLVLPLLVWAWGAWLASSIDGRPRRTVLDRHGAALVTLVVVVAFTVVRNLGVLGDVLASGAQ